MKVVQLQGVRIRSRLTISVLCLACGLASSCAGTAADGPPGGVWQDQRRDYDRRVSTTIEHLDTLRQGRIADLLDELRSEPEAPKPFIHPAQFSFPLSGVEIVEMGKEAIPRVIERLMATTDRQYAARLLKILDRITGLDLSEWQDDPADRVHEAKKRWESWLAANRSVLYEAVTNSRRNSVKCLKTSRRSIVRLSVGEWDVELLVPSPTEFREGDILNVVIGDRVVGRMTVDERYTRGDVGGCPRVYSVNYDCDSGSSLVTGKIVFDDPGREYVGFEDFVSRRYWGAR